MSIVDFIKELKRKDIKVLAEGGDLKVLADKSLLTQDLLSQLKERKQEILEFIDTQGNGVSTSIAPVPAQEHYDLSHGQRRIWILDQIEENQTAYNMPVAFVLRGADFDVKKLEEAFNLIIKRHETLRTVFKEVKGVPVQLILEEELASFSLDYVDLEGVEDADEEARELVRETSQFTFSLSQFPLIKATLIKRRKEEYVLSIVIHHIICDGWSQGILYRELLLAYQALTMGVVPPLKPLKIQYKDYAAWQIQQLNAEDSFKHRSYWIDKFKGDIPVIELPTDFPRPATQTFVGDRCSLRLDLEISKGLKDLSENQGASLFMTLLALVKSLIYKYTGQTDIIIGSPAAGRDILEIEDQIGLYLNMLALRTQFQDDSSFTQLLDQVRNESIAAYQHQIYPFDKLVEELELRRDVSRSPLFDIMVNMQNAGGSDEGQEFDGLEVTSFPTGARVSQFDLTFLFAEEEGQIELHLDYNIALFKTARIEKLLGHFDKLCKSVIAHPEQPIKSLAYLSDVELEQLQSFNDTEVDYESDKCIHELFRKAVDLHASDTAIYSDQRNFTFQEVEEHSTIYASQLKEQYQIGEGDLVGIMLDRGPDLIMSMLAVLKTGAAYVPLDPEYPEDRNQYIFNDARLKAVLVNKADHATWSDIHRIDINSFNLESGVGQTFISATGADRLAYVIYTSGSTGKPKGVCIHHRNLSNFLTAMDNALDLNAEDHLLALTSSAFDISFLELMWTLCRGIPITIRSEASQLMEFDQLLTDEPVTNMDFGLFYFASQSDPNEKNKYRMLLDSVEFADRTGFSAVWTPERHFHDFGGIYPNPSVIGAALAARTEQIDIRAGSVVLPLHDVIRVAENWSVVDNLSGGRVSLSIAPGWHANDFVLFPNDYSERHKKMFAQIEELKHLWEGGKVSRTNGQGNEIELEIFPRPVQDDLTIWLTAGGSPETFVKAGEIGANVLTHLIGQDIEDLASNLKSYRESLKKHHPDRQGRVALMLHTFLDKDRATAVAKAKEPFKQYLLSSLGLRTIARSMEVDLDQDINPEALDELLELAFERYWQTAALIGTPEDGDQMIRRLSMIGVTEIACLVDFGIPEAEVMQGLEILAEFKDRFKSEKETPVQDGSTSVRKPITAIQSTPSLLRMLVDDTASHQFLKSLKHIIIGGEPLPEELLEKIVPLTDARLYNMYGPTETTIWSTADRIQPKRPVSIGKPVANTQIYILDKHLTQLPLGVHGEIYIGGAGVGSGYLGLADLSEQRFLPNPIKENGLIYRTGDLGRWTEGGKLEILGRVDQQVKIRGYRIELGEIESILIEHPQVELAVAVVHITAHGTKEIRAYYKLNGRGPLDLSSELRSRLQEKLPAYMIPAGFYELDSVPLTPNGKVDRKELASWEVSHAETRSYEPPTTEIECLMVEVWSDVLGQQNIGVSDNFFELGGDSIKAIQISSGLFKKGYKLKLRDIIRFPTIGELAHVITENNVQASQAPVTGTFGLTPIQQDFFAANRKNEHHFNQSVLMELDDSFSLPELEAIFSKLHEHHDALRMTFTRNEEGVIQYNGELDHSVVIESFAIDRMRTDQVDRLLNEIQGSINLNTGPLVKLAVLTSSDRKCLLVAIHHLVVDGISWRILFDDFQTMHDQWLKGDPLNLPPKTDSFKKWSEQLYNYAESQSLKRQASFWKETEEAEMNVPQDFDGGENKVVDVATENVILSKDLTMSLLNQVHTAYGTEINDLLLLSLALAFRQSFGLDRMCIWLEGHGREDLFEQIDVTRTIGWFTSLFPIALDVSQEDDFRSLIVETKEYLRRIPDHGIGYGILKFLTSAGPLSKPGKLKKQVCFNYLGQFDEDVQGRDYEVLGGGTGHIHSPEGTRDFELDVQGMIVDKALNLSITYSQKQYKQDTIKGLLNNYLQHLEDLITFCSGRTVKERTPSDFTMKDLSIEELDTIFE